MLLLRLTSRSGQEYCVKSALARATGVRNHAPDRLSSLRRTKGAAHGSLLTPRWRELDSNPRSPVTRHPDLDVRHRRRASALTALALRCKVRSTQIRRLNATP